MKIHHIARLNEVFHNSNRDASSRQRKVYNDAAMVEIANMITLIRHEVPSNTGLILFHNLNTLMAVILVQKPYNTKTSTIHTNYIQYITVYYTNCTITFTIIMI